MVSATEPRLYCVPATEAADDGSDRFNPPDGAPPGPWTKTNAYRFCERMAATHYENFPVASKFLPAHLRPHIAANVTRIPSRWHSREVNTGRSKDREDFR